MLVVNDDSVINLGPGPQVYNSKDIALENAPGKGYDLVQTVNKYNENRWFWVRTVKHPFEEILNSIKSLEDRIAKLEQK